MENLEKGSPKLMQAWAFYDWANSVYTLVIASTIFPIYYGALFRQKEIEEITVIEKFLPAQLEEEAIKEIVAQIIATVGATGPQDLGKVMGVASKQLAGQADGKAIAAAVKAALV